MPVPKTKFREIVLQLLYSRDVANTNEEEVIAIVMETLAVTKSVVREAQKRVDQIREKLDDIDKKITSISTSYALDRIQRVERNVIRLGVYEILYDEEIPPKVAISEAMRLAKKFSTPEASSFVNALLDAVYKIKLGEEADIQVLENRLAELNVSQERARQAAEEKPDDSL